MGYWKRVAVWLGGRSAPLRAKAESESWWQVASWPGCAYKGGISWSVPRYGDNEAFVLSVLAREMRTIDREKLMAKLKRIKGKKSYSKILDLKQLKLELA